MSYSILDIRGRLLRKFYGSNDATVPTASGLCTKWQVALHETLEQYVWPIIESGCPPINVIAVWDSGNNYRRALWPDYKKERREQEQDPVEAKEIEKLMDGAKNILAALGIKQVYVPGEEADDVIALLCQRLEGRKIVFTSDKDLLVLVNQDTYVNLDGVIHGAQGTVSPFGVAYGLTSLHKALVGDRSDGYGGVPGFGQKAFDSLRDRYQDSGLLWLQSLLDADTPKPLVDYLADPAIKKIYDNWHEAVKCWRLAKPTPEACYGSHNGKVKRPKWHVRIPSWDRFVSLYSELHREGFGEAGAELLAERLNRLRPLFPSQRLITAGEANELAAIMQEAAASDIVAYDFESYDTLNHQAFREAEKRYVDVLSQRITGISINYGNNNQHTVYVSFEHADTANLSRDWAIWLLQVLSARAQPTVVHNASFELSVSMTDLGLSPAAPHDTMVMASYVDENEEDSLKEMSLRILGYRQLTYQEVTGGRGMNELTGEEVLRYGCDDSLVTAHLYSLYRIIMQCEGSWRFYTENEIEPALDDAANFIDGVAIDFSRLAELRNNSRQRLKAAKTAIRESLEANLKQTQQQVQAGAATLLAEWWTTEKFKYENDPEMSQEHYAKLWRKAWEMCLYKQYAEQTESAGFSPTATVFAHVLSKIDNQAPRPKKLTGKGIAEYDLELAGYIQTAKISQEVKTELTEFQERIYKARFSLSPAKRSGHEYDQLKHFCSGYLDEFKTKTIKTGTELNYNSDRQMQALLYGILGLPVRRRSKPARGSLRAQRALPGAPATGLKAVATALVFDLQDEQDWRRKLLENYAAVAKELQLESLYFSKYPLWKHPRDGKVHPGIKNCGTVTRRPSGSNPNVLQVAKGPLRTVFIGGRFSGDNEPRVVVSLDYANQELVLIACESRDPVMLDAFSRTPRRDIHTVTSLSYAAQLLPRLGAKDIAVDYEGFYERLHDGDSSVSGPYKQLRNKYSKACNFLISYAGGPTTLAENLSISVELAKNLMQKTFALYSRIRPWQHETAEFARRYGYTQTAYGNRRHVTSDIHSLDDGKRKRMERQACNFCIQGGAADILKVVRQALRDREVRARYSTKAVFPVYDELTASVPISKAVDYALEMKEIMEIVPPGYPIGMQTELSIGPTWGNQKELPFDREAITTYLETLL